MAQNNLRISQGLEILYGKINLKYFRGREGEVLEITSTFLILKVSFQFLCGWVDAVSFLIARAVSVSNRLMGGNSTRVLVTGLSKSTSRKDNFQKVIPQTHTRDFSQLPSPFKHKP